MELLKNKKNRGAWSVKRGAFAIALALSTIASAFAGDINKGYTFVPLEKLITNTKLNNLVDAASINTSFYTDKAAVTTPSVSDLVLLYSVGVGDFRKCSLNNIVLGNTALITGQTEDVTPATNDYVLTYDASATLLKKTSLNSLVFTNADLISTRTNWATPDPLASFLLINTAGAWAKVNPSNLFYNYANFATFTNLVSYSAPISTDSIPIWDSINHTNKQITLTSLATNKVTAAYATNGDFIELFSTNAAAPQKILVQQLKPVFVLNFTGATNAVPTSSGTNGFAHGLPGQPQTFHAVLQCAVAELGYLVGEEVDFASVSPGSDSISFSADATKVYYTYHSAGSAWSLSAKTGSFLVTSITKASWRLKFYATYFP